MLVCEIRFFGGHDALANVKIGMRTPQEDRPLLGRLRYFAMMLIVLILRSIADINEESYVMFYKSFPDTHMYLGAIYHAMGNIDAFIRCLNYLFESFYVELRYDIDG